MSTKTVNSVVVIERLVMCSGCVGFARSFEFSFSLGSWRRDGGTLRLIYDNGSGAASPAAADNFFFFAYAPRKEVPGTEWKPTVCRAVLYNIGAVVTRAGKNCYDLPAGNVNFVLWIR